MNNSQFWSWTDHWEGWDFMSDEQEHHMLLEDWDEELFCELDPCISERELRIIMICMICGNSVDCCIAEKAAPTVIKAWIWMMTSGRILIEEKT